MQKYLKNNNKGFTLVEVIVVAVIVLILAAVAIPLYNGYVNDSREATATNIAATVAKTVGTALALGHYNDSGKACDDVTAAQSGNGTITVGTAPNEVSVSWDEGVWDVGCAGGVVTVEAIDVRRKLPSGQVHARFAAN